MADPIVIYDPEKEIAAIVDPDNRLAFGPAMIGKGADTILESFLTTVPYDIRNVGDYTLRDWFEQFAQGRLPAGETVPATTEARPVEQTGSAGVAEAKSAEQAATATAASAPPPAPADTDMEANTGQADQVAQPENPTPAPSQTSTPEPAPAASSAPIAESPTAAQEQTAEKPYEGPCFACEGTGNVPGAGDGEQIKCNLCKGTGQLPAPATA